MATLAITIGISVAGAVLPLLFAKRVKTPPVDKNAFPDLQISTSDQGQFIAWARGTVKVPCNIIWSNGIQHYRIQTSGGSGGKGGGTPSSGTVFENVYQTSVALLCTDCGDNPVVEFLRVWADNEMLYNSNAPTSEHVFEAEDATLSGGASTVTDAGAHGGEYVTNIGTGGQIAFDFQAPAIDLREDDDGTAVSRSRIVVYYKSSSDLTAKVTINSEPEMDVFFGNSGGVWAAKTITFLGIEIGDVAISLVMNNPSADCPDIDYVTVRYDTYHQNLRDYPESTGVIDPNITYPADRDDPAAFYDAKPSVDADGSSVADLPGAFQMRFYTGTATQMPDPAIVAWLTERYGAAGADMASAYRTFSLIILENFTIKNGRMPNFTAELNAGRNDVAEITEDIYNLVEVDSSELFLDDIEGSIDGVLIYQFTPAAEIIKKLQTWANFQMVEIDGMIKAVPETGSAVATIPYTDLKAHDFGEEMPAFEADHLLTDEQSLPNEIIVSAMDVNQDYHANPQSEQLFASTVSKEPIEMSFPFVATPEEMKRVSNTQIAKAHLESRPYTVDAMPEWGKLTPMDIVNLQLSTRTALVKVRKKSMALMGKSQLELVPHSNYIYQNDFSTGTRRHAHSLQSRLEALPKFPRNSILVVIESIPILREQVGELGVYIAVSGRGFGRWDTAAIYRDMGDDNYEPISQVEASSPIGVCQNILDDWASAPDLDTDSEVTVYFYDDIDLENIIEGDARNNPALNLIRIGSEWCQFLTASAESLPAGSVFRSAWTISDFIRGGFDTETEITGHAADEIAVVATSALKWRRFETVEIDTVINLKAVTNTQAVEYAETVSFTLEGLSLKALAKTEDYTVTFYDDLRTFTNRGATGFVQFFLPSIFTVDGFEVSFVVYEGFALQITPQPMEDIFIGEDFGSGVYSATPGSFITIRAMGGAWISEHQPSGVWTFGSAESSYEAEADDFFTAAGISDVDIENAVNQLVLDLKSASLWTKAYAIYPMVGGTSGAHAVNLKSPGAFDLTFSGTWNHTANGATPTSSHADTGFNPSTDATGWNTSNSLAVYSRTSAGSGDGWIMGVGNTSTGSPLFGLAVRRASSTANDTHFDSGNITSPGRVTSSVGSAARLTIGSCTANNHRELYQDGSSIATSTSTDTASPPSANIYIGSMNPTSGSELFQNHEIAFAWIGQGLSDTEAGDLNTIVDAFQTALGREV